MMYDSMGAPVMMHDTMRAPVMMHDTMRAPVMTHDTMRAPVMTHDSMRVPAFDDQKHPQAHGGAFFQAVLTGPAIVMGTVRDFDNGWYEVKLRLHEAGHYK
eukprot:gene31936-40318_t